MALCRRCRVREADFLRGLCTACYWEEKNREENEKEERKRERKRERAEDAHRERMEELQRQAAEDASEARRLQEKAARDAAEAKRIAGLKTYTCYHCKANFNEEQGVSAARSPIDEPLCNDCRNLYVQCSFCKRHFWSDKTSVKELHVEYVDGDCVQRKTGVYKCICLECLDSQAKEYINTQEDLRKKYELQEKERQEREERERIEREEKERQEREERERKKREEKELKEREENERKIQKEKERAEREERERIEREERARKRKQEEFYRALACGGILLSAAIVVGVWGDVLIGSLVVGGVLFALSLIMRKIASKLLFGMTFALIPNFLLAVFMSIFFKELPDRSYLGYILVYSFIAWTAIGTVTYPKKVQFNDFLPFLFKPIVQCLLVVIIMIIIVGVICQYGSIPLIVVLDSLWADLVLVGFFGNLDNNGFRDWLRTNIAFCCNFFGFGLLFGAPIASIVGAICSIAMGAFVTPALICCYIVSITTSIFFGRKEK